MSDGGCGPVALAGSINLAFFFKRDQPADLSADHVKFDLPFKLTAKKRSRLIFADYFQSDGLLPRLQ